MIKKTNDYSILKKHISNRELDRDNLARIKASLSFKNMLNVRPILVNKQMEIIDGNHRFAAAKELGIEIYYMIQDDSKDEDIVLLNTNQKPWNVYAYLNYYCSRNNPNYVRLKNFMEKMDIKDIYYPLSLLGNDSGVNLKQFKQGKFVFSQDTSDLQNSLLYIRKIQAVLDKVMVGKNRSFYKSSRFVRSLGVLSRRENFDYPTLIKKLEGRLEAVYVCYSVPGYIEMLKKIYNWKNSNSIE